MPAITVRDVNAHEFVKIYAAHLKATGKIVLPKWVDVVKTGRHKELAPYDPNWFYLRCAAIARHIYIRSGVGVGALMKRYGGAKRRGARPTRYVKGSGSIARAALKCLESLNVFEKDPKG
jgi:small subunit ribosomal protein S19e